jgi:DNA mismatch endonuclease (patch repair protein)
VDCVMDVVSPAHRSMMMRRIRGKGTKPELVVRKAAHKLGYRFRLHKTELPGTPDLVFSSRNVAVFVHGCFWHRHQDCRYCYNPKSNIEFWKEKFKNNVARDERAKRELERLGWRVAIIWECETADPNGLDRKLKERLGP